MRESQAKRCNYFCVNTEPSTDAWNYIDCTLIWPRWNPDHPTPARHSGWLAFSLRPCWRPPAFFFLYSGLCLVDRSRPTAAHQDPLSMGILQTRTLGWAAKPSSRGSSRPGDRTQVSRLAGGCFTIRASREAPCSQSCIIVLRACLGMAAPMEAPPAPRRSGRRAPDILQWVGQILPRE